MLPTDPLLRMWQSRILASFATLATNVVEGYCGFIPARFPGSSMTLDTEVFSTAARQICSCFLRLRWLLIDVLTLLLDRLQQTNRLPPFVCLTSRGRFLATFTMMQHRVGRDTVSALIIWQES